VLFSIVGRTAPCLGVGKAAYTAIVESVGQPRYMATMAADDIERTLWIADNLIARPEHDRVALVQCGRASRMASELADVLTRAGRTPVPIVIRERDQAQSEVMLRKLSGVSAVWVFVEDLFDAYMCVFATRLTFAMRAAARNGLPVVGVGRGALVLGGLLVAQRVCTRTQHDLVTGLGWAPRLLLDSATAGASWVARDAVCSLPGLLGVEVGLRGGIKVEAGRVESVGEEPIVLLGADVSGQLLSLTLEPGQITSIAPPPFPPFTKDLLSMEVRDALSHEKWPTRTLLQAPPLASTVVLPRPDAEDVPEADRICPMCNKVHKTEARLELAA
jgi:hypothetical protein